jgi:hypothetical protein
MLYFIYQRLLIVLEWIGKIWRRFDGIERQLSQLKQQETANAATLAEIQATVDAIAASVIPEPAAKIEIVAGPIEEQP